MYEMASPSLTSCEEDDGNMLVVVDVKEKYTYTVPSFSVFTVRLRHIRYEMIVDESGNDTVKVESVLLRVESEQWPK